MTDKRRWAETLRGAWLGALLCAAGTLALSAPPAAAVDRYKIVKQSAPAVGATPVPLPKDAFYVTVAGDSVFLSSWNHGNHDGYAITVPRRGGRSENAMSPEGKPGKSYRFSGEIRPRFQDDPYRLVFISDSKSPASGRSLQTVEISVLLESTSCRVTGAIETILRWDASGSAIDSATVDRKDMTADTACLFVAEREGRTPP